MNLANQIQNKRFYFYQKKSMFMYRFPTGTWGVLWDKILEIELMLGFSTKEEALRNDMGEEFELVYAFDAGYEIVIGKVE